MSTLTYRHPYRARVGRVASALAAALALVIVLPGGAVAAPGDLDPSFGSGGKLTIDRGYFEEGQDAALQPDGKIVTVGTDQQAGWLTPDFSVTRHNADGSADTSFGDAGETVTDFGGGTDQAQAVALQPDGKIVVVGRTEVLPEGEGGCCWFTVARYTAGGSLDTTFSGDGWVRADFGDNGSSDAQAVAVQPDGRIVAAGQTGGRFAVVRYDTDGNLDTSFGGTGKVVTPFDQGALGNDMALQPDGRIVVAGYTGSTAFDFALVRYNTDGGLDTTFGTGGRVITDFGDYDVAQSLGVQPDGRIVAAGYSGGDFALARYTTSGGLDATFGTGGKTTTDLGGSADRANDMALQSDGRIVAAGIRNTDFAVARYNTDGTVDTGFGTGGRAVTDFGYYDEARSVAVQSDGRILTFGNTGDDRAMVRYLGGNGTPPPPDLSVAKSGTATVGIGDRATYTVTVTNNSTTTAATGVALTDTLTGPAATVISATPGQGTCTTTATGANCSLGTLAAGAHTTVTVVVEPRATGTLTDRGTVTATQTDPIPGNNSATATTTVNNSHGCTIIGTSGNDTLNGTYGNDVICALGGDDTVNASFGNDTVYGGYGNDRLDGSYSDDTLNGGPGNDNLIGNYGNDKLNTVDSVSGNDTANGGLGTDTCTTDTGDTRISCP
ncbi:MULTISPECIES: calcium-binding protein [unclassified Streptomyces]|uniref:calcium-binding protein n=1 Tax=unclassified Streptomyces TaxID=2593676 RepID=UPI002E7FBE69|nr:calcium-binding protein [Streptomyces sp. NBC_00589]WTI35346.1 calcium-binding protein [Streptomyces sp. NBC_00775]WUB30980.1 calcium-binding protein [Streptomyces sp. NBC_00589]